MPLARCADLPGGGGPALGQPAPRVHGIRRAAAAAGGGQRLEGAQRRRAAADVRRLGEGGGGANRDTDEQYTNIH